MVTIPPLDTDHQQFVLNLIWSIIWTICQSQHWCWMLMRLRLFITLITSCCYPSDERNHFEFMANRRYNLKFISWILPSQFYQFDSNVNTSKPFNTCNEEMKNVFATQFLIETIVISVAKNNSKFNLHLVKRRNQNKYIYIWNRRLLLDDEYF